MWTSCPGSKAAKQAQTIMSLPSFTDWDFVGEGLAEPGKRIKRGISLESFCNHKQTKSNPPLDCRYPYLTITRY